MMTDMIVMKAVSDAIDGWYNAVKVRKVGLILIRLSSLLKMTLLTLTFKKGSFNIYCV